MVSRTDPGFVADRLSLASRDNMGGLRIKPTPGSRKIDGSDRSGERSWEDPDGPTSRRDV